MTAWTEASVSVRLGPCLTCRQPTSLFCGVVKARLCPQCHPDPVRIAPRTDKQQGADEPMVATWMRQPWIQHATSA